MGLDESTLVNNQWTIYGAWVTCNVQTQTTTNSGQSTCDLTASLVEYVTINVPGPTNDCTDNYFYFDPNYMEGATDQSLTVDTVMWTGTTSFVYYPPLQDCSQNEETTWDLYFISPNE
jgi:hypothetical protein